MVGDGGPRELCEALDNLSDALSRIRKNLGYFRANYLAVLLGVVILSMLWNPISIIVLALLGSGWAYLFVIRMEPLVISGRVISDREKLIGMAAVSIPSSVFGITSVGSVLISGVIVGMRRHLHPTAPSVYRMIFFWTTATTPASSPSSPWDPPGQLSPRKCPWPPTSELRKQQKQRWNEVAGSLSPTHSTHSMSLLSIADSLQHTFGSFHFQSYAEGGFS